MTNRISAVYIENEAWSKLKLKLNCCVLPDWARSVRKTRQDNDLIDHIGAIYAKNETKQS